MFAKPRLLTLLAAATVGLLCLPLLGAGEDAGEIPTHVKGFFEIHYVLTELIVFPIVLFLLAVAMASNEGTKTMETRHYDFWKKPLGKSYTQVPIRVKPSTPDEIRGTLTVFVMIYLPLRLTCLCGFFNALYQMAGGFLDIFFK